KEVVLGSNALNRLDPPLLVLTPGDAAGTMLMGGIDDMDFENSTEAQDVFWNATDGSWIFEDVIEKQIADVSVTDTDICLLLSTGDAVCWNSEWSLTDVTKLVGNRGHVCVIQEGVVLCNPAGDDTHGQSTPTM